MFSCAFLVVACILHLIFGGITLTSNEYKSECELVSPICSILIGLLGIIAAAKKHILSIGIFAGAMLILTGLNSVRAAFLDGPSLYDYSYYMIVTISIIEVLAFIASLYYAKTIQSRNENNIELNASSINTPTNK